MAYCTIQELRNEGLDVGDADATRVQALIDEWSLWIDRATGQFFDQRTGQTLKLDGTGTRILHLPVFAMSVTELRRVWRSSSPAQTFVIDTTAWVLYDRLGNGVDDRYNPKIKLLGDPGDNLFTDGIPRFTRGTLNYEVDGDFGFCDADGSNWVTPDPIKRACKMLVIHHAGEMGDPDANIARQSVDLTKLTVMGRSYEWGQPVSANTLSGIPDVDRILALYRSPMAMRAA